MNTLYISTVGLVGALAVAGTVHGQQPPDVVKSDGYFNTAMGTDALLKLTPGSAPYGRFNTAAGAYALSNNTTGYSNTAVGADALTVNTTGGPNTALGVSALQSNTTGSTNTATGFNALSSNDTGIQNTATGDSALLSNTDGGGNSAFGGSALYSNTTGGENTACGADALHGNTTGSWNTACGGGALLSNTTGNSNTASGFDALFSNTTGSANTSAGQYSLAANSTGDYNTASGYEALYSNNANSNTASGYEALYANKTGTQNTASGVHALAANTTGSNNIAEGYHGGINLTTGSDNIDIGSPGVKAETGVIRIGTITGTTSTQSAAYIAGIYGVKTATAGTAVFIDSSGQLGTVSSSIRYKEDIQPMAEASERLLTLRPVKFRYKKADASGEKPVQYGLIAEEVAKVYPELVVRDAATGRIDGVRYDELAPLLLNEVQQQQRRNAVQDEHIATQEAEIRQLKQQLTDMHAALVTLQSKGESAAQR